MSGKCRRSEASWDMKQEKMPPKSLNSESKDHGRLFWKGNRNLPKDDDISRDRHDDEYSTRLPYRGRDDESRSPNRSSRDWESARARSRSPFYDDRHKSKIPNNSRLSSRPCNQSWSCRPNYSGGSRYSDTGISKIQCKFFAAGNCNRDDCKFSHDVADKNRVWHDLRHADLKNASSGFHLSEKKKPWDDVETGGVDETRSHDNIQGHTCSNDKKKSSQDDVSNPSLENKNMSWNGPLCDVRDGNEMKKLDEKGGCADFLYQQHNVVNGNILSEETNQQILAFGKGQVENGKSPKKQNNCEQEQKSFNPAKLEEGNIGNYEKCMRQSRSPNRSRSRDRETNDHVRSNSRPYKGRHSQADYSRYSHNNRNSRNHYDDGDGDDDQIQSNRISNIQCKFFSAGNCQRDDCKFSHDSQNHDWRSHDEMRAHNMTWHDADLNASDLSEKKKPWGDEDKKRTWGSDDKKRSSQDDVSNPNLDDKNDVDASGAKSFNNVGEKTKPLVQMDDEKGCEKNDYFLPQQHNVVNDSPTHLNNSNVLSEKGNIGNLANAIDYLKSLPNSTHNQDTRPKEGNIGNGNGKTPKEKHQLEGNAKKEEESVNPEKVKEDNDEKSMQQFRIALVEFIKQILKPKWKEGKMTREVHKTIVKKVVEKITSSIQEIQIPRTEAKIELYLTHSKPKIMKLVEAYVEKLVKT